jgi:hypothetical protein
MGPRVKYLVISAGAGETERDFTVLALEADSPAIAVERLLDDGYGRDEDGVAYVVRLEDAEVFQLNVTSRRIAMPSSFEQVVADTPPALREFLDRDGGHE